MNIKCKYCQSDNVVSNGKKKNIKHEIIGQRFYCNDCRREFYSLFDQEEETGSQYKYEERKENAIVESPSFSSKHTDRVKVLEDFLSLTQVDLEEWEVEKYTVGASDVTMSGAKSSTGEDATYTNYNIKVWLKKRTDIFDKQKFTEELIEDIKINFAPHIKFTKENKWKEKGNNLFIPNLYDIHLGRLCWHEESGENYDINIAANTSRDLLERLFDGLSSSSIDKIDRICFPIGNDFLNYDYAEPYPMTTNQTPQEADVRWQKMFRIGRNLLYGMIDWMYSEIAPVDIVVVPGNHEEQVMFYLGEVIEAKYTANDNVSVDNRPINRKYYKYGKNLIGFAHGKDEKDVELHNLMSLEVPQMWADTKYRYYYLGHNHHEKSLRSKTSKAIINQEADYKGVMINYLPAVAKTDKYEHKKGYEGSIRGARGMIHDYNKGRMHIIGENI